MISDDVASERQIGTEANRVGKAIGFGGTGKGRDSNFRTRSKQLQDREYYLNVLQEIDHGTKLYIAYNNVAQAKNISPSTVGRAYRRVAKLIGSSGEAEPEAPS